MTRWAIFVLLAALPNLLSAQSVTVRSGEHGTFTRLVLSVPSGAEWSLISDQEKQLVSVTFSQDGLQFDTSRAFDRISRDRVSGIEPSEDGKGIEIGLACSCTAEAFILHGDMLVIDVSPDGGDTGRDVAETGKPKAAGSQIKDAQPSSLIYDLSQIRVGGQPGLGPMPVRNALLPMVPSASTKVDPVAAGTDVLLDDPKGTDGLGRQIAADLAVAATSGLLDPAIHLPPEQAKPHHKSPEIPTGDPKTGEPGDLARQLATGLSALDHDALQRGHIAVGGDSCEPDAAIAVHKWVETDADPSRVLAEKRGKVFGEFDRIDRSALNDYAKALLYFGFGAEARTILALDPDSQSAAELSLSYLVDGEPDPFRHFSGNAGCAGYAAFWSVLSSVPGENEPAVDVPAVIRTFEALPKHLRSHLGPGLSENLLAAGYHDGASDVLRRLQRMEGEETDSIALGKAHLDLQAGDLQSAGKRLHDLSVSGGPEAVEAIVASIDVADAAESKVPERVVALSEAFATESRNPEDGENLWPAYVRSLLVNEAFEAAFSELENAHGLTPEALDKTKNVALGALAKNAQDVTFLKIAARYLDAGDFPAQDTMMLEIAQRFLDLDMPELALGQLDARDSVNSLPDARILRAKALLALSRPEDAEIILIGQKGEDVERLRAEARRQMGDHVFAKSLYSDIGDERRALNSAWLSEDWQDVAQSDSFLAPAASLMQDDPLAVDVLPDRLGAVDALAEGSAQSRETLQALLAATAIPGSD